ncbi:MAG: hypothetical protein AAF366_17400 [Pseudomonadota bacterium]
MIKFALPLLVLLLTACQGSIAYLTPTNELRYGFLNRDDANTATTLFDLGPVGTPTRDFFAFAENGAALATCFENRGRQNGNTVFRTTMRLHDVQGAEVLRWTDRDIAAALDGQFGGTTNYRQFVNQGSGRFGRNHFICWAGGPRQGASNQLVVYLQPQFNTEIAALNVAVAFNRAGRIVDAEIFDIAGLPTGVVAVGHPTGQNVLTQAGNGTVLVNGAPVVDASGAALVARDGYLAGVMR